MDNKAEITCVCAHKFNVNFPPLEITNQIRASLVIASHERPVQCPNCGASFLPAIQSVQGIAFEFKHVPKEFLRAHGLDEKRVIDLSPLSH